MHESFAFMLYAQFSVIIIYEVNNIKITRNTIQFIDKHITSNTKQLHIANNTTINSIFSANQAPTSPKASTSHPKHRHLHRPNNRQNPPSHRQKTAKLALTGPGHFEPVSFRKRVYRRSAQIRHLSRAKKQWIGDEVPNSLKKPRRGFLSFHGNYIAMKWSDVALRGHIAHLREIPLRGNFPFYINVGRSPTFMSESGDFVPTLARVKPLVGLHPFYGQKLHFCPSCWTSSSTTAGP